MFDVELAVPLEDLDAEVVIDEEDAAAAAEEADEEEDETDAAEADEAEEAEEAEEEDAAADEAVDEPAEELPVGTTERFVATCRGCCNELSSAFFANRTV